MVEINIVYQGQLRCTATHGPSGTTLATDAPTDNMGRGEFFSPTDLVATALGSCMMTTMGIVAQRHSLDITGTQVHVEKHMSAAPPRRIARLPVIITFTRSLSDDDRRRLEHGALTCPVHKGLHPEIDAPVIFRWADGTETRHESAHAATR